MLRRGSLTNHFQAEVFLKGIEIAVVVEKRKGTFDAEGCNPAVDDLTYGKTSRTKFAVVDRALDCIVTAHHPINTEVRQVPGNRTKVGILDYALQDFAKYQIAEGRLSAADQKLKMISLGRVHISKEVDPYRC